MSKAATYWKNQGKNFMTPSVIEYRDLDNGLMVELSEGTGMNREPIFGVSVANAKGERLLEPESQMFWSLEDARRHIDNLS